MQLQPSAFVYMAFKRMIAALIVGLMIGVFVAGFGDKGAHVPPPHQAYVNWPFFITVAIFAVLSFPGVLLYSWFLAKSYQIELGEDGIHLRYGVIGRTSELMPYGRIQDFVISQSILERLMSLVTIKVQNAMGRPITIVGFSQADAEMLRDTAIARAKPA
jgi:membrane protein YdbS with pleckstrin-like domain